MCSNVHTESISRKPLCGLPLLQARQDSQGRLPSHLIFLSLHSSHAHCDLLWCFFFPGLEAYSVTGWKADAWENMVRDRFGAKTGDATEVDGPSLKTVHSGGGHPSLLGTKFIFTVHAGACPCTRAAAPEQKHSNRDTHRCVYV